MIDISKLKVSLTKHGIHKLARLIELHSKDDILSNARGTHQGINIYPSQVSSVLSVDRGIVPNIWNEIKIFGTEDIQDLIFVAIVFSHHSLMEAMIHGNQTNCDIVRHAIVGGKTFTNFAHTIEEFNFAIEHTAGHVSYDISRIFYKPYLTIYIRRILRMKMMDAGWDGKGNDLVFGVSNNFHKVFGLSNREYINWLQSGKLPSSESISTVKAPRNFPTGIKFRNGHSTKYEGAKTSTKVTATVQITYRHNEIQNAVYLILNKQFPELVGTEVPSNNGSIDVAVKFGDEYSLYEIKTARSCRANIRQGLAQILEYAYWKTKLSIRDLTIIGPAQCGPASKTYLQFLRDEFKIPIFYQYYDEKTKTLSQRV